jgi:hypothetical protein
MIAGLLTTTLLSNLINQNHEQFRRQVIPHLKPHYFQQDAAEKWTCILLVDYWHRYNQAPTKESLLIELAARTDIGEQYYQDTREYIITHLDETKRDDLTWLLIRAEKWVQDQAIDQALYEAIAVLHDNKKGLKNSRSLTEIPAILQEALSVSFQRRYVINANELLKNYKPPEYLIEDLFKRGDLYSFTGATGSGKTAVALPLAWHVATGANLGNRQIKRGRVVYFAGENPSDVTQGLAGMLENIDALIDFDVVPFASRQSAEYAIAELIAERRDIALVVIDTSAAYFAGEDENNNKEALDHAKWLRSISKRLPGNPTVLVCCHPTKYSRDDDLIPRGGGAFLAEMDGNLWCEKAGDLTIISRDPDKYRDVYFEPFAFRRSVKYPERLKNPETGKAMPTIVSDYADEREVAEVQYESNIEDMQVLEVVAEDATMSLRNIADKLYWMSKISGLADGKKVDRIVKRLQKAKLIDGHKHLTKAGEDKLHEYLQSARKPAKTGGNGAENDLCALFLKGMDE